MPTVHLTLQQLREAIESLTPEEFQQLNQFLDTRRRIRLKQIIQKSRSNAAKVSAQDAEQIIRDAIAEVRARNIVC